jgi:photosystem II stability/assembly factor-like uncharacterized protein
VWGTSTDNIYAVGSSGTILHSDGSGWWSSLSSPVGEWLEGISGTSDDDIWVVGRNGTVLRGTGSGFTDVSFDDEDLLLTDVLAISPTDVWVVGGREEYFSYFGWDAVVLHWNGSDWHEVSAPLDRLYAILQVPGGSLWASGYGGTLLQRTCE